MPAKKKKAPPKKKPAPKTTGTEVARAARAVADTAAAVAGTLGQIVATAFTIPRIGPKKKTPAKRKPAPKLDKSASRRGGSR